MPKSVKFCKILLLVTLYDYQKNSLEDASRNRKLQPKFCGPFKILQQINEVTFGLDLSELKKEIFIMHSTLASFERSHQTSLKELNLRHILYNLRINTWN